jgi:hypothetical protein
VKSLLDGAKDWKVLIDFGHKRAVFPPEIYSTSERPDIVIWSSSSKTVIVIELTCPSEEGIEEAEARKIDRYKILMQNIRAKRFTRRESWTTHFFTVEVGARGYVANSMMKCLHSLGFTNRQSNQLRKAFSEVASRCSYTIYLSSTNKTWDRSRELLVVPISPPNLPPSQKPTQESTSISYKPFTADAKHKPSQDYTNIFEVNPGTTQEIEHKHDSTSSPISFVPFESDPCLNPEVEQKHDTPTSPPVPPEDNTPFLPDDLQHGTKISKSNRIKTSRHRSSRLHSFQWGA